MRQAIIVGINRNGIGSMEREVVGEDHDAVGMMRSVGCVSGMEFDDCSEAAEIDPLGQLRRRASSNRGGSPAEKLC